MYPAMTDLVNQFDEDLNLHNAGSEISISSVWSRGLDSINSSIGDLKKVLKKQDRHISDLITENELLKNDLKKIEKELKKQKYLLKAEREMHEQFKRDTAGGTKKCKSEETHLKPTKHSDEMLKIKSELNYYKRLCAEQHHETSRLSKINYNLRTNNVHLRAKFMQHENQYNKFISEMAFRFEVSRKEFYRFINSNKSKGIPLTNLAVLQIADRNARLAHDNSLLKLKVNNLEKSLELMADKTQTHRSTVRSESSYSPRQAFKKPFEQRSKDDYKINVLKPVPLSSATTQSSVDLKLDLKSSVTSLVETNKSHAEKKTDFEQNKEAVSIFRWKNVSSEESVIRTESAPQLNIATSNVMNLTSLK